MPDGYRVRPEQAIVLDIDAWNANCPQHVPRRYEAADVEAALALQAARIAELEREVEELRAAQPGLRDCRNE